MAIDTYSALQTEVAAWMQRSDLSGNVPTFIEFATAYFNQHLRVPQMEGVAQTTVTGEWTALPDDYLGMRYIEIADTGKRLTHVSPEEYALLVKSARTPEVPVYMIGDMSFRIYPTQSDLDVEILYYQEIPEMVNASDTNWLLEQYPNAYLSAALMYGFDFVQDDARAAKWEARTKDQIGLIQRTGQQLVQGASTMAVQAA